ncbi:MAG TPA: SAM-dependent chlorinase/fluorinase [Anaeromyxobacteraceae bacterium]|nr:SAM-dependent chlorinase/fluorinase [Anaeromyxobacteraceae bacterium]
MPRLRKRGKAAPGKGPPRAPAGRARRARAPSRAASGPPIVTFLSDFGVGSGFPAQMKGEVLRALPEACLVDLSHEVPDFDILSGALLLEACVPRFPAHAVHVAVVDPGVGTERRPICVVDARGHRLVGPDNGIFTPFLGAGSRVYLVARGELGREPRSATFHGRDVFAPVAAWLAKGGRAPDLGPPVADPVRIEWAVAARRGAELEGICLVADAFGNVLTSVRSEDLHGEPVSEVLVNGHPARFVQTFGEGAPGELLALLGSSGRMEVAVREGSAARELGVRRGAPVVVKFGAPGLVPDCAPATLDGAGMTRTPDNQRRTSRLYHELPVAYRSVGSFLTDWATNISQGGLFINTRHPLPVGTLVKILIQLPVAAFPVDLSGRVTRVAEFDNQANVVPGMGIEFTDVDSTKKEQIEAFVQKLRQELGA